MFPLFDVTQVPGQRFNLWHKETTNFTSKSLNIEPPSLGWDLQLLALPLFHPHACFQDL